jgi:4-hydroxy-tetrahydrodipicolinate reductase
MNIALIGYGKMGRIIEEIALERGHHTVLKISSANAHELTAENLRKADVAIEFTSPHSAFANISACMHAGVPVVCGSTGWNERLPEALLAASNFSIGVNIFFEINKHLAALMNRQPDYDAFITEIHHTGKKDAPSGTAITLAEQVLDNLPRKTRWVNRPAVTPDELSITSQRTDPAPGTHIIKYSSAIDDIEITHTAHNRRGFATGAVLAAEFIAGKTGVFSMKDVLQIQ